MGLLTGKNIVITGVLTDASLAFGAAKLAQEEGAEIVLTGAGRALSLTERVARKLPTPPDVYELDVTVPEHLANVRNILAKELGPKQIRCNLVAAGPIKTMAAKSIPGFAKFEDVWSERAPLGWDVFDSSAVAKAIVALLSDWFPATTGEIIHVDGGFHAV